MSKQVIILKGLPGCGKTTWAKEQIDKYPGRYKRINKDDLRLMLDNGKWSQGNEKFVLKVRDALILLGLQEGYHVIVDDTNLHPKHERTIRELVQDLAQVEIKDFTHVPLDTCIERDRHRPNYVGEQVIRTMYRDFLQPKPPVIVDDPALPRAIICDLDGTLALLNGRNPYDASKCEQDHVNEPIADIVKKYHHNGYTIILVSGRSSQHQPQTERWLQAKAIPYHALFMRSNGDNRQDTLVKREIYEQHIYMHYHVHFVLDDRSSVIRLWRELGLTTLQVADGDF